MRRFALVVAVLLVAAPPARGAVLAEDLVAAGPVLDGSGVTWGTEPAGAMVVRTWEHGAVRDRVRLPAATQPGALRQFSPSSSALVASSDRLALVSARSYDLREDEQGGSSKVRFSLWSGPAAGPLAPRPGIVSALDAKGSALAWAEEVWSARRKAIARTEVRVDDGGRVRRWRAGRRSLVRRVRLAGRFVGWAAAPGGERSSARIRVVDRATGRTVLSLRGRFSDFALQPDGTVAALRQAGIHGTAVVTASPAAPRLRELSRTGAAPGTIEAAGGRAVFTVSPLDGGSMLGVVPLSGGDPRLLVRYSADEGEIGGLDFDGQRLAWAQHDAGDLIGPGPTRGRVHLIDVP